MARTRFSKKEKWNRNLRFSSHPPCSILPKIGDKWKKIWLTKGKKIIGSFNRRAEKGY